MVKFLKKKKSKVSENFSSTFNFANLDFKKIASHMLYYFQCFHVI